MHQGGGVDLTAICMILQRGAKFLSQQNESYNIRRDLMAHNWKQSSPKNQALDSGHNHNLDSFAPLFDWFFDGSAKIVYILGNLHSYVQQTFGFA